MAVDPVSLGVTLGMAGLNAGLGLRDRRKAKAAAEAARAANERRYLRTLDLLREQGAATKADIRAGAASERAAAVQGSIGRGLYNTSLLDTVQSQANDREARAMANVDQNTARQLAGVMESRVDEYPNGPDGSESLQAAGQGLAQVAQDVLASRRPRPQGRVSDRYNLVSGADQVGRASAMAPIGMGGVVRTGATAAPMAMQAGRYLSQAMPARMRRRLGYGAVT
jgi:hypothetical protein